MVERGGDQRVVESFVEQLFHVAFKRRPELLRGALVQAARHDAREGLGQRGFDRRVDVVSDPIVEQGATKRRLVAAEQCVHEHAGCGHALHIRGCPNAKSQPKAGVVGCGGHFDHLVHANDGRLQADCTRCKRRFASCHALLVCRFLFCGHRREVALVEPGQHRVYVEVAVEHDACVVGAVVAAVLVEEGLARQRWDGCRRAARLEAIRGVGEERGLQRVKHHRVRVRKRAFHLVEDDAVVHEGRLAAARHTRAGTASVAIAACLATVRFTVFV